MINFLYNWVMSLASHPRATPALAIISFLESSVFPIPPDTLLIPMTLADRRRAWRIAFVCTAASVLGGVLGYILGLFFFEEFGRPLFEIYGYADHFTKFQSHYHEWGAWIVIIFGVSFLPYKVITILSGVVSLDPVIFLISSIFSRGLRFYIIALLLWKYGEPIRNFIEARLGLLFIIFCILLISGIVTLRFII